MAIFRSGSYTVHKRKLRNRERKSGTCGLQRVSRKIKNGCVLFKYILLTIAKDDFTCDKKKNTFGGGALVMHFIQLIL